MQRRKIWHVIFTTAFILLFWVILCQRVGFLFDCLDSRYSKAACVCRSVTACSFVFDLVFRSDAQIQIFLFMGHSLFYKEIKLAQFYFFMHDLPLTPTSPCPLAVYQNQEVSWLISINRNENDCAGCFILSMYVKSDTLLFMIMICLSNWDQSTSNRSFMPPITV